MGGFEKIELARARLEILKHWIRGRRNGISFRELISKVLDRSFTMKAKSVIKETKPKGPYLKVRFNGLPYPLYYPAEMQISSLYQVVAELFFSSDWHYYENEQTRIDKEDTVVDCGAGEGLFSLMAAGRCRKVYAIEPLPRFVEAMKLTFSKFNNVDIIQCALSDHKGQGRLSCSGISSSLLADETEGVPVDITTLDDLLFKQGVAVNYIKADLEGFEMKMLRGAINTLRTFRPKIAITTYHQPEHAYEILAFLKRVNPSYKISLKGLHANHGTFVMLHASMS